MEIRLVPRNSEYLRNNLYRIELQQKSESLETRITTEIWIPWNQNYNRNLDPLKQELQQKSESLETRITTEIWIPWNQNYNRNLNPLKPELQ